MKDMSEQVIIPELAGYVSIREAAQIIGCTPVRVYQYVKSGQLPAQRVGHMLVLPKKEVQEFRPGPSGRLRANAPQWKTYRSHVQLSATLIQAQIYEGQREKLLQKFNAANPEQHTFTGTIARYVFGDAEDIQILLIWKDTEMPDEATQQQEIRSFQKAFSEIDWETAEYRTQDVFLHT